MEDILVLCCRADRAAAAADDAVAPVLGACSGLPLEFVGPRPGKEIDTRLTGRVIVVGDDADLAAVVLRLVRRDLLGDVILGYATARPTPVTDLWSLPTGPAAVRLAAAGDPDLVPVVRDDVGGVVAGRCVLFDVQGTVYVDEHAVLRGAAEHLLVTPHPEKGLEVTIRPRRLLGVGRRPRSFRGRAVQIGTTPALLSCDGITYGRPMDRWTLYKHTQPLRLVRGLL